MTTGRINQIDVLTPTALVEAHIIFNDSKPFSSVTLFCQGIEPVLWLAVITTYYRPCFNRRTYDIVVNVHLKAVSFVLKSWSAIAPFVQYHSSWHRISHCDVIIPKRLVKQLKKPHNVPQHKTLNRFMTNFSQNWLCCKLIAVHI